MGRCRMIEGSERGCTRSKAIQGLWKNRPGFTSLNQAGPEPSTEMLGLGALKYLLTEGPSHKTNHAFQPQDINEFQGILFGHLNKHFVRVQPLMFRMNPADFLPKFLWYAAVPAVMSNHWAVASIFHPAVDHLFLFRIYIFDGLGNDSTSQ